MVELYYLLIGSVPTCLSCQTKHSPFYCTRRKKSNTHSSTSEYKYYYRCCRGGGALTRELQYLLSTDSSRSMIRVGIVGREQKQDHRGVSIEERLLFALSTFYLLSTASKNETNGIIFIHTSLYEYSTPYKHKHAHTDLTAV